MGTTKTGAQPASVLYIPAAQAGSGPKWGFWDAGSGRRHGPGMRTTTVAGRLAAIGLILAAIIIVAILLFAKGGTKYTVDAYFLNAAQLVKGDLVQTGGTKIGSVKNITLTENGQARIHMEIQKDYTPLRVGTQATVRQASLSGIANRYVDLTMPSGDSSNTETIPSGGSIDTNNTTTAVDLDQLFNTLDDKTSDSIQAFFRNSATQFRGKERQQRLAFKYLNPALSTSSRLFNELNRDQPRLEAFLVDSAKLVTTLADRRDDLAALIGNLNQTFTALGNQREALAESISLLPGFMRQANTTFVDLRFALDDVDPLVNASKPVAPKLNQLLLQLRPFANDARPTVRDLSRIVFQPGKDNDLYDLQQTFPPVAQAALDTQTRRPNFGGGPKSVGRVRGAFPEMTDALRDSAPIIGFGRPYTPDLMGWFDDFSTTGLVDAGGNVSRAFTVFNAFTFTGPTPGIIPLSERLATITSLGRSNQYKRCPGGAEVRAADGSNVYTPEQQQQMECTESARASGVYPENKEGSP
jgi:phospholipid/cholesterol/gamma-HCH transport system substrate-binding protein